MKQKSLSRLADEQETTERPLDTAERLLGEHGSAVGVCTRWRMRHRVNMGATTYHFGSKEALYRNLHATLSSCNAERLRLLRKAGAEAKGKPLTVEKIVDCMVRPPFLRGSAHPKFHALLARNLLMPPLFLHAGIQGKFEPTLPSCSRHSVVPLPV